MTSRLIFAKLDFIIIRRVSFDVFVWRILCEIRKGSIGREKSKDASLFHINILEDVRIWILNIF